MSGAPKKCFKSGPALANAGPECHGVVRANRETIETSDARLFCKNKQVNFKHKRKMGNSTEKQAQYAFGNKIQQNKKSAGKSNKKQSGTSEKTNPK